MNRTTGLDRDRGRDALDRLLAEQVAACAWLRAQWQAGTVLAANCTGTFLLARTGLLDGREATTTWWLEKHFRVRYPAVELSLQDVLTEADRLLCAGASASYLLQAIRVIELCCGPVVASRCAKSMLIDVSQTTQMAVLPLLAQKVHSDALVRRAQALLKERLSQHLRIEDVAEELSVSERTLMRRFRGGDRAGAAELSATSPNRRGANDPRNGPSADRRGRGARRLRRHQLVLSAFPQTSRDESWGVPDTFSPRIQVTRRDRTAPATPQLGRQLDLGAARSLTAKREVSGRFECCKPKRSSRSHSSLE